MSVDLNKYICFNFYNGWREILLEMDKEITMNELSKGMNLDSSAVSTLVSRMEKKSLVKRTHGTEDRRTVFVKLTQEGFDAREKLRVNFDGLTNDISEDISPKDVATLQEIVGKIAKNHKRVQNA